MKGFFGYEGGFFSAMDKLGSLFWLNILCIVCSIPLFTIGASVTAMYYVTLKMARDEECYITKEFFRSFKQNFRQATLIWLLSALLGFVFIMDFRLLALSAKGGTPVPFSNVITVVIGAMVIVFGMVESYVFPLLAKFDNSIRNTIKNSLLLSIRHLPWTALILVCNFLFPVAVVLAIYNQTMLWIIPIALCLGISSTAYLASFMFVRIFDKYIPEESKANPEGDTAAIEDESKEKTGR